MCYFSKRILVVTLPCWRKISGWILVSSLLAAVNAAEAAKKPDFSGIWQFANKEFVVNVSDNGRFTPEALTRLDYFRSTFDTTGEDDQGKHCVLNGMPWTMTSRVPYPIEIFQTKDRIVMMFELMDMRRNIYLNLKAVPDEMPPTGQGFSIGRWEGSTLVIETTRLKSNSEYTLRPRSEMAHITERWKFVKDPKLGETIVVDMRIDDPEIYIGSAHAHQVFKRAAKGTWVGDYACDEYAWEEYIAKRKAEIERRKSAAPK